MSRVTFQWHGDQFVREVKRELPVALAKAGEEVRQMAVKLLSGPSPSKPGSPPGLASGKLRWSIYNNRVGKRQRIGTLQAHGAYMEYGVKSIRPKRVKYLPVPLNYAARRILQSSIGSIRNSGKQMRVIKYRRTNKLVLKEVTPTGKFKKNGAAFLLSKKVRILPRPWLRPSVTRAMPAASRVFNAHMESAMLRAAQNARHP